MADQDNPKGRLLSCGRGDEVGSTIRSAEPFTRRLTSVVKVPVNYVVESPGTPKR